MKKKILSLAIIALTAGIIPHTFYASSNDDISISNDKALNFVGSFNGKIKLSTNIEFKYDNYLPSIQLIDQFDKTTRTNKVLFNGYTLQETYVSKLADGSAVQQYISVSNTVEQSPLTDSNGKALDFDDLFGSPFERLSKLNAEQVNSYFVIKETNSGGYEFSATDFAYGILNNSLLDFFSDYDSYYWDLSVNEKIENLVFITDAEGNPTKLTFNKIKKDKFGGIRENYTISIETIEELELLSPVQSKLSQTEQENFETKMSSFQEKLNKGNFTQNISITSQLLIEDISYSNYYSLDTNYNYQFIESMICSYAMEEATYGRTFVTLLMTQNGFSPFGISPDSTFYGNMSSDSYQTIEEVVPRISDISANFFTYNEKTNLYTFDFNSFLYGDNYFCGTILVSLYGIMDPAVQNLGLYIDDYSYTFDSLVIGFDENGYPYGTLNYKVYGYPVASSFTFSDVGTTNLLENKEIEEVVNFIQTYML